MIAFAIHQLDLWLPCMVVEQYRQPGGGHSHYILVCAAEGRVENNNIMCAYHAWSFSSKGNLVDVPQAHHSGDPDGNARACASRRGCVATYPVMVSLYHQSL